MRMVLLGAPGSGKGTQAAILSGRLGVPSISTGEMLRKAVSEGSALGRKIAGIMATGDLVDDETMAEVVRERLSLEDVRKGFILDGYPRTENQAETLNEILAERNLALDAVIHIDVPEDELVKRSLARHRDDDREEVIRQRQRVYLERTAPLVDYYAKRRQLTRVDGHQPIERVASDIVGSLPACEGPR